MKSNYECVIEAKAFMERIGYNYLWDILGQPGREAEWVRGELERWCFTIASTNIALAKGLWALMSAGCFVESWISIQFMMPPTQLACEWLRTEPCFTRLRLTWVEPEAPDYVVID